MIAACCGGEWMSSEETFMVLMRNALVAAASSDMEASRVQDWKPLGCTDVGLGGW